MATLVDALNDPAKKPAIIQDCLTLIDAEVKDKKGMGGMAVKAGYGAVKGIKPGFIRNVVEGLMPEFAEALAPIHDEATTKGEPISVYLVAQKERAADALLEVTDGKAAKSTNGLVKKTYSKLRGSAKKNVEAAIPRLGALIEKHV